MTGSDAQLGRFEGHLGRLLFVGVTGATIVLSAGLVLTLMGVGRAAQTILLNAGLVVLMATPILRVIVSVVEYARMRDWFFVATTLLVLGVLATTVFYAFRV